MKTTFNNAAYQILAESNKALHSKDITAIALKRSLLKTSGKTPQATMNSGLIVDINKNKNSSRFKKVGPSTFSLNESNLKLTTNERPSAQSEQDVVEAYISNLVTLLSDKNLSCFKAIGSDSKASLIVNENDSLKPVYLHILNKFESNPSTSLVIKTKASNVKDSYSMLVIICSFDAKQDIDSIWLIPASEFIKHANHLDSDSTLEFVVERDQSSKWDTYLIDKNDIARQIKAVIARL